MIERFRTLLSISTCVTTAWSPDGLRLASTSDAGMPMGNTAARADAVGLVIVWDTVSWNEVVRLEGHGGGRVSHSVTVELNLSTFGMHS